MTSYLLDTNVVSEARKPTPHPAVEAWLKSIREESQFLSVITLGELRRGMEGRRRRDPEAALSIEAWFNQLVTAFADRIVPVTVDVALRWGRNDVPDRLPAADGLLAATALVQGWTLATRNVKDVERTGVRTVNPWEHEG